jgi:translocation and assembly module TamB
LIKLILSHLLLTCLLIFAGMLYFLGMTTQGLKVDIELAARYLPGQLRIAKVEGKLFSTLSLQNISYQDESQTINISALSFAWQPLYLLTHKVMIDSIKVTRADINIKQLPLNANQNSHSFDKDIFHTLFIKQITLDQIKLNINNAKFVFNGTLQNNWNMQWNAEIPALSELVMGSSGSLSTHGKIVGALFSPTIQMTLQAKKLTYAQQKINQLSAEATIIVRPKINSTFKISAHGLTLFDYAIDNLNLTAAGNVFLHDKILDINLTALLAPYYPLSAQIKLPKFSGLSDFDQPIIGQITSSISHLDLLAKLIPTIKNPKGALHANLILKGTFAQPNFSLDLAVLNGQFKIPALGITLQNITLQGKYNEHNQLNFNGTFRSGKGDAELKGNVDFNQANYPIQLTLKGSQLAAIDLAEYQVTISPDVRLIYTQENLQVEGNITIPYAEIMPKNFNSSLTLPEEVIFIGKKQKNNTLPFTTHLQLSLQLGDKIHVVYNHLEANLAGKVQITQIPGALINAVGELYTTKGTYAAYGQTLAIQTGRLIYTGGSLTNPGLTISAIKKIKTVGMGGNVSNFTGTTNLQPVYTGTEMITAGVQVNGTLADPILSLFSTPTLSQGDILSYLLFGYPQSQVSGHQYGTLLSALSSLNSNTSGISGITKKVQQKLGINELNVESTQIFNPNTNSTVSTTTLVVGKQLSKKLSLHYSIGLFYPVSILNLRYTLSKRWAIQSETSTIDNGADLLYSIESD